MRIVYHYFLINKINNFKQITKEQLCCAEDSELGSVYAHTAHSMWDLLHSSGGQVSWLLGLYRANHGVGGVKQLSQARLVVELAFEFKTYYF